METLVNNPGSLAVDEDLSSKLKRFFRSPRSDTKRAKKRIKLFIVDDDPMYLKALEMSITANVNNDELVINSFQTGEACLQQMKQKPAIVILDYFLNSKLPYAWDGATILKHIKRMSPATKVIMLSSQDSLRVAIDCMENGAYDYISKTQTALLRINNMILNISGNIEVTSWFFKVCGYILLFVIIALAAYSILNH
jgi:PleD family two-component response regulator